MVNACNLHGIIVAMQLEKEPRRCCRTFIHSKVVEYYCLMINQNSNPNITNLLCCFHQYTAFIHRSFVLADLVFLLGTAIFLVMLCILVQLRSLQGNRNRHENSSKLANVASPGGPGEPSQLVEGPCNLPDQQRDPMEEDPTDPHAINSIGKTLCGFADVYWPNSLVLDIVIRSSKYTEDLNLSESLDGLRRLIATSLDALQNCSLFGFVSKKDKSNMV
ncbi:hypothetical protein F2Q69_00017515 [Brassica cretica]|uniref:Uncharacterized protein n=1 Tax=Brassica cretica TaxID=69181 RepID=A0A8S9QPM8_BRACR|nr:hypothetical protein F2Q69_00017515 [Brassica cretica]